MVGGQDCSTLQFRDAHHLSVVSVYVAYYLGMTSLPVLLGMAAFPPLSFLLVALHRGNYPVLATSIVFGVVHVGLTYANFGPRG